MQPIFKYIPDALNNDANYCAIEHGEGFMHICLLDKNNKTLIAQEYFRWALGEKDLWKPTHSTILNHVQEHSVVFDIYTHQPHFTLLPQSVVEDDKTDIDILFLLTGQKNMPVITEDIDALNLRNIYIDDGYVNTLPTTTNLSITQHFITNWLTQYSKKNNGETVIDVVFYPHYFLATVWKEGKLQLIKYLYYKTNEDILYALLQLMQYHKLDNAQTPIHILGAIELSSNVYQYLQQYFVHMHSIEAMELWKLPNALVRKCPAHLSAPLLLSLPCA